MSEPIIVYPDADEGEAQTHRDRFKRLHEIGEFRLFTGRPRDDGEYIERVRDANAILLGWDLSGEVMRQASALQVVSFTGIGAARFVDIERAKEQGVSVCNCPGYSDNTVAEHALALLMAVARNIPQLHGQLQQGQWNQAMAGMELRGKHIGLIGFGGIGARFAEICVALGMRVSVWTRNMTPERRAMKHVEFIELAQLYQDCDIVSLHLASTSDNDEFVNAAAFEAMKPGSVFINSARAELVDEKALLSALRSGHLRGAGIDVFWEEPCPSEHPLMQMQNVVLTPHIGFKTPQATASLYDIGVDNIVRYFAGSPINLVT